MTTDLTQVKDGMTSQEIAEITGKRHDSILRDIRNLLSQGVNAHNFVEVEYLDKKGETRPSFNLTPKGVLILASGYNALLREKIINRLEELEVARRAAVPAAQPCAPETVPMERGLESEYIVFWHDGVRVVSSRTLAWMCRRNHGDLMRSVRCVYRHCERPRRLFIEVPGKGGKLREILITAKGFTVLRSYFRSLSVDVCATVSVAFARAHRGIGMPVELGARPGEVARPAWRSCTPGLAEVHARPGGVGRPTMPSDPSELLARFTKAMAVMLGVSPDNLSGLMQKGGEL